MASTSSQPGSVYWSIVVGGRGVHNRLLEPKVQKKNAKGELCTLKNGDPWLEYCSPLVVASRAVKDFATRQEFMTGCDKKVKEVFNELKCLIRQSKRFLVVYHPAADPCSLCVNNHYHIIIGMEPGRDMDKEYRYRKMREAARDDGPLGSRAVYCKYQRVKVINAMVRYLSRAPRVFYGTNVKYFLDLYHMENQETTPTVYDDAYVEDVSPSTVLGELDDEDDDGGWGAVDIFVDGDDFVETKKRTVDDWADDDNEFDDMGQSAPKKKKGQDDTIPRLIEILVFIFTQVRSTDKMTVRTDVGEMVRLNMPHAKNMLARLKNVLFHRQCARIWENGILEYRSSIHKKKFGELCASAWISLSVSPYTTDLYIPLDTSVQLVLDWLSSNGHKPTEFLDNCRAVLKRESGKLNCIFCCGESNAGKTVMFAKPLEYIMTTVGRIVSLNVSDRFIFEACVGQRLISIEECLVPKLHQEEIKKIMGGESCQVQVKYAREGALLSSTPVIATSNLPPWHLEPAIEVPLRNRMYYYTFRRVFAPLEDWQNKQLDPRAYLVLWTCIASGIHLSELYKDEVLHDLICDINEQHTPNCSPLDDIGKYPLYQIESFDFLYSDRDIRVVGYISGLPVLDPTHFNQNRIKRWPFLIFMQTELYKDASNFWINYSRIVEEYRIIARFQNCIIGCNIGFSVGDVPHGAPFTSRFLDQLRSMELNEGSTSGVYQITEKDIRQLDEYYIDSVDDFDDILY